VSRASVIKILKMAGIYAFVGNVIIDVVLTSTGQQPPAETIVNTSVGGIALWLGGVPGLTLAGGYWFLNSGLFTAPSTIPSYTPPSIAMPDATGVAPPILNYP
jgi:hypothetical protein